jgi:hypothetical protein
MERYMLPTTVTLMGIEVKIQRPDKVMIDGDDTSVGSYDGDANTIEVLAGLDDKTALSTLAHEMCHAWLRLACMTDALDLNENREEALVLSFETHFLPVLIKLLGAETVSVAKQNKKAAKRGKK